MDSVSHQSPLLAVQNPASLDSNSSIGSPKEPPLFLGRQLVACDNTKKHQQILDAFKVAQEKYQPASSSRQPSFRTSMSVVNSSDTTKKATLLANTLLARVANDSKNRATISSLKSEIEKAAFQIATLKSIPKEQNKSITDLCSKLETICNRRANLALAKLSLMEAKLDPSNKRNIATKASAVTTAEKHYRTAINELNRSGFQLKPNKPADRSSDADSQISQEIKEKEPTVSMPRPVRRSLEEDIAIGSDTTEKFKEKLDSFKNFLRAAKENQGLVDEKSSLDNSNSSSNADGFDEPLSDLLFSDYASFDTDERDSNPSEITTDELLSLGSADNLTVLLPSGSDGEIKSLKKEPPFNLLTMVRDLGTHHEHLQSVNAELFGNSDAEVEDPLSDVPKKVDYHSLMDAVIDELAIVAARQDSTPLEEARSNALSILGHSQPRNTIDAAKLKEWIEPSFTDSNIHLGEPEPPSRIDSKEILSESDDDPISSDDESEILGSGYEIEANTKERSPSIWRTVSDAEAKKMAATANKL